jgi:hypothetical protein
VRWARARVRDHLIGLGLREDHGKWDQVFRRKMQQNRFWQ